MVHLNKKFGSNTIFHAFIGFLSLAIEIDAYTFLAAKKKGFFYQHIFPEDDTNF